MLKAWWKWSTAGDKVPHTESSYQTIRLSHFSKNTRWTQKRGRPSCRWFNVLLPAHLKHPPPLRACAIFQSDCFKGVTLGRRREAACPSRGSDPWIAALEAECRDLSAPQHSYQLLCFSLHNYIHPGHVSSLLTICSLLPIFWACQLQSAPPPPPPPPHHHPHPSPAESILALMWYSLLLLSLLLCFRCAFSLLTHTCVVTHNIKSMWITMQHQLFFSRVK